MILHGINMSAARHITIILGYLSRTFFPHCLAQSLIHLYKAQVLPVLDHGCIVWDHHLNKHKTALEKVQLFATRMATKQWQSVRTLEHSI